MHEYYIDEEAMHLKSILDDVDFNLNYLEKEINKAERWIKAGRLKKFFLKFFGNGLDYCVTASIHDKLIEMYKNSTDLKEITKRSLKDLLDIKEF